MQGNVEQSPTWPAPDRQGWHADSTCTAFSHLFFNILFDSINHFHVHTYISRWGPEEQSPSLEIKLQLNQSHTPVSHLFGWRRHPLDEGGGNWSPNAVI